MSKLNEGYRNQTTTAESGCEQDSTRTSAEVQQMLEMFQQQLMLCQKLVYTNEEVLKMLGVCANTLKKYRDNGYISYSRVADKYFYSPTDIANFLKNNHYSAFHYEN